MFQKGHVEIWLSLGINFSGLPPTLEIAVEPPILEAHLPAFFARSEITA
jgi:hypothetical protein